MHDAIRPFRILIVEDHRDTADALQLYLDLKGHDTLVARDGAAALTSTVSFQPDVILLDIQLPKLSGFEVCRAIRQVEYYDNTLIIACTGCDLDSKYRAATEAGFDLFLPKPLDLLELENILQKHADGRYGGLLDHSHLEVGLR